MTIVHGSHAVVVEAVEDAPGPAAAPSVRIGPAAEFVEQDQALSIGGLEDAGDAAKMCELKVLSDCSRLCSSPISARICSNTGALLPLPGRDVRTGLGHQAQ